MIFSTSNVKNATNDKAENDAMRGSLARWMVSTAISIALLGAGAVSADDAVVFELRPDGVATPPIPVGFDVEMVLDDNSPDGVFGIAGTDARQFLWFNQFPSPGVPTVLEEIWVLFPAGADVVPGADIELVVYQDPDGDPTNGADLLAQIDETIQVADGLTFSIYALATPVEILGTGDVLIGVVNRYFETGVTPPPTLPASLDTTASENRSWYAIWTGDAPMPPELPPDDTLVLLDGALSGNWMIRGFGRQLSPIEIPTLGHGGMLAMIALLMAAALWRRRQALPVRGQN